MADPIAARIDEIGARLAQVVAAADAETDGVPMAVFEEHLGDAEALVAFAREVRAAYLEADTARQLDARIGRALCRLENP